jgi:hypothetical protein
LRIPSRDIFYRARAVANDWLLILMASRIRSWTDTSAPSSTKSIPHASAVLTRLATSVIDDGMSLWSSGGSGSGVDDDGEE